MAGRSKPGILNRSLLLKIAVFATGLSGIVAEYVLATLATYFLGNQLVQWTLIISVMLFSMGLGSRLSRKISGELLYNFLLVELTLSLLVSFAALTVYSAAAYTYYDGVLIYSLSIAIGFLIGLEIPLVTRINNEYEALRVNISSVMEHDYYGSLIGGMFFAFIGLPILGLTYTPFVLGLVNLSVALILFLSLRKSLRLELRRSSILWFGLVLSGILIGLYFARPVILHGEQARYLDKVVYEEQSTYQKITLTQWKDDFWLYINGNQQLSSLDEYRYHEPMTHLLPNITHSFGKVLVLGGGDGCAVRELLKYKSIEKIELVDLDPSMTRLAKEHELLLDLNDSALYHHKVSVINADAYTFLEQNDEFYDAIIIDLPDPKTVELSRLYSAEFYRLCALHLNKGGALISQAGSPFFAVKAFYCIEKSMKAAGFHTLPLHNQIPTMGEWGWILAHKELDSKQMEERLKLADYSGIETQWLTKEAIDGLISFGKPMADTSGIKVNHVHDAVLQRYYLKGNWDIY